MGMFRLSKERWLSQSKPERHAATTSTSCYDFDKLSLRYRHQLV
ncbi:MAG: hypothetical protein ACPG8W_05270 [Candidatus Promineifilaceae bacterium]